MINGLFNSLLKQNIANKGIYLLFFALSLAVTAITALQFSQQHIQTAIQQQSGALLAADMVLSSSQPLEQSWQNEAIKRGLSISNNIIFNSMIHTDQQFLMVNVKAVDDHYPLRGAVQIKPHFKHTIQQGQVWLPQRIMDLLNVKLGDNITIADAQFKITAIIIQDSNQETGLSGFSPTVIIHLNDVERTHAVQLGSRIDYRLLISGTQQTIKQFTKYIEPLIKEPLKLRQAREGNTRLMRPFMQLEQYLQLTNLLTLLLCGITLILTARQFTIKNKNIIALLRCLGASRNQLFLIWGMMLILLAFVSMIVGLGLGMILGYSILKLVLFAIPQLSMSLQWIDFFSLIPLAGMTTFILLMGFIIPSLVHLIHTSPIQILRQNPFRSQSLFWLMLIPSLSLFIFVLGLNQNLIFTISIFIGVLLLLVILFFMTYFMVKLITKIEIIKQKLRIYQPLKLSGQITALALGLSLICVLLFLRTYLLVRWQQQLPKNTPNQFIYGLPANDKIALEEQLKKFHWQATPLYINVKGRLTTKNNEPFSSALIQENDSLKRELNLTQTDIYPQDNQIIAGQVHFNAINQVSVEEDIAKKLNIKIGDQLRFSLPEGKLDVQVINLRKVEWESFSPNFFFIFSPNTLDVNAGSYLGSFYVPPQDNHQLIKIIKQFPSTVFIDVEGILQQAKQLLDTLFKVIAMLALLVLMAGFLVLLASLNMMIDERRHEIALLRAIGVSQQQLKYDLTIEFASIGLFSGCISIILAEGISYMVAIKMKTIWFIHFEYWIGLPLFLMIISALMGRYRLGALWSIPPLRSLIDIGEHE